MTSRRYVFDKQTQETAEQNQQKNRAPFFGGRLNTEQTGANMGSTSAATSTEIFEEDAAPFEHLVAQVKHLMPDPTLGDVRADFGQLFQAVADLTRVLKEEASNAKSEYQFDFCINVLDYIAAAMADTHAAGEQFAFRISPGEFQEKLSNLVVEIVCVSEAVEVDIVDTLRRLNRGHCSNMHELRGRTFLNIEGI